MLKVTHVHMLLARGVIPRLYQVDKDSVPVCRFRACRVTPPTVSACGQRDLDWN